MSKRSSNGRSPLVNPQRQITTFFSKITSSASPGCTSPASPACTSSPSSVTSKLNPNPKPKPSKSPLVIDSAVPESKRAYGGEVVGRRVRVYWPLDGAWYEGVVKAFDGDSGKHLVEYDDAEEEELRIGEERVEWVEGEVRKFRRLRRVGVMNEDEEMEAGGDDDGDDGDDDSGDEDWGKNVEKELFEEDEGLEDMDLVDEEEGEEEGTRKGNVGRKVELKKRKASEVGVMECKKKNKSSDGVKNGGLRGKLVEPPAAVLDCKRT